MKLGLLSLAIVALIVPAALLLTACGVTGYQALPVARAVANQSETTSVSVVDDEGINRNIEVPPILEYFTDGDYNFFLLEIGTLQNTFLANIFPITQTLGGAVTIQMVYTQTSTESITEGMSNSVTNSMTSTTEAGMSATLSASVQARAPFVHATVSSQVSSSFSVTQTQSNQRSWTTNMQQAVSVGTTTSFGVTIGPNATPGWYRAALFASSEIYVILQTNRDNTELVGFKEVTVATQFTRRVEFSADGNFDNTPVSPFYLHNMADPLFLSVLPEIDLPPEPEDGFRVISAGSSHTAAITMSNELWVWGNNNSGQLGDGTSMRRYLPIRIGSGTSWSYVTAGASFTVAITTSGQLWAWGNNFHGQLGDGTRNTRLTPVRVGTATNWRSVSAGNSHVVAITTSGQLFAWGNNENGQLGDGTTEGRFGPTRIGIATNWRSVSAGTSHVVATTTSGQLWAWGNNGQGRLGDGTVINRHVPTRIGTGTNWETISAGGAHTVAVTIGGELWAWGNNGSGRLGDGSTADRHSPVRIGVRSDWVVVSAGGSHTVATTSNGQLWSWGWNAHGQLGNGVSGPSAGARWAPALVGIEENWLSVVAAPHGAFALQSSGEVWAWGLNSTGELGDGTSIGRPSPVLIASLN